jgi:hypothetical protein
MTDKSGNGQTDEEIAEQTDKEIAVQIRKSQLWKKRTWQR